jgi:hypothetical protein
MPEALFACPPPTALATIPAQTCPERFDQIVKFYFQRVQATPSFTTATILLQATWTPLLTAVDSTKVVKSPLVPNVVIPVGEVLKEGGNDNTTINGIPRLAGRGFVAVTANLQDAEAAVRTAIRALAAESALQPGYTNLWVYPVNRFGQILGVLNGSNVEGIKVYNLYVGDTGTEGLNKSNINNLTFDLEPGWSDNVKLYTPTAFNMLNL